MGLGYGPDDKKTEEEKLFEAFVAKASAGIYQNAPRTESVIKALVPDIPKKSAKPVDA